MAGTDRSRTPKFRRANPRRTGASTRRLLSPFPASDGCRAIAAHSSGYFAHLPSCSPSHRARPSANVTNARGTAEGDGCRPLAHKAGEHVHAGDAAPRRKAEASPPHGSGSRENQNLAHWKRRRDVWARVPGLCRARQGPFSHRRRMPHRTGGPAAEGASTQPRVGPATQGKTFQEWVPPGCRRPSPVHLLAVCRRSSPVTETQLIDLPRVRFLLPT